MATHQSRPGGRLLEVLLALSLAVFSASALLFGLALAVWVLMAIHLALYRVSPVLAYGIMAGGAGLSVKVVGPVMQLCWKGLAAVWRPFLAFYGYEAHTLRPLNLNDTTTPGDGRGTKEG